MTPRQQHAAGALLILLTLVCLLGWLKKQQTTPTPLPETIQKKYDQLLSDPLD